MYSRSVLAAKQLWLSNTRMPLRPRAFRASNPQISIGRDWFDSRQLSPLRRFPDHGFPLIDLKTKVEEEKWPWYSSDAFYPARIGELLHTRYRIIGKSGYGGHSTAWLCRDLREHKYVVAKICENTDISVEREVLAYTRINSLESSHTGSFLVRKMLDTFEINNKDQKHTCLIHEPLGMSLETCRYCFPGGKLSDFMLKPILKHLIVALHFLHTEAGIVHTDLKAANVHFRIADASILKEYETNQMACPSARKTTGETIIYESRGLEFDKETRGRLLRPTLIDFGEARCGRNLYHRLIQPAAYRAPEVIFKMPWDSSVDIWNLGVLTWHLRCNQLLFTTTPKEDEDMAYHEVARMIEELGMPPIEFIDRLDLSQQYLDDCKKGTDGRLAARLTPSTKRLMPSDTAPEDFIVFMKKMLAWLPEERQSAEELFADAWLNS
ncbi:hypothetical protein KC360_g5390 [Hortaea werneckii]|nr:hypothetical protein KC325_g6528 [Hortaea werneckii]KAI6992310.1 hypothetical protein KC359_g5751 [Hortaea werneckii]KAI7144827.1 hypothetical protein KC344_g5064 [Hortaea werneckii]KAI7172618.1 hypothetical protein KC360_g5390 [Hortaea werneckii]